MFECRCFVSYIISILDSLFVDYFYAAPGVCFDGLVDEAFCFILDGPLPKLDSSFLGSKRG